MSKNMEIVVCLPNGKELQKNVRVDNVLVVGYGGRNIEKIKEHIHELELIGVAPPPRIPMLYLQGVDSVPSTDAVAVKGAETSGEVEYVLFNDGTEWLVTVGSDHTDRRLETVDVAQSKAACPKPMATTFWKLKDLEDHWDELVLKSWVTDEKGKRKYQDHNLTALLPVADLFVKLKEFGYTNLENTVIFSGTVPTLEGFVYGYKFESEIYDPKLNRSIVCNYDVVLEGE